MRRRLPVVLAALTLSAASLAVWPATPAAAAGAPAFITGTGDRTPADVELYDAAGNRVSGFYGFNGSTGARVASGDVDGDLQNDVVVGTGAGVASQVNVFSINGGLMGSFSPYGAFGGGVNVAVGDVDADNVAEIITAADAGGGPHVIVWDWNTSAHTATAKYGWFAYDPSFKGGVNVAVANVVGSGRADIVTAPGAGGGPHVRIWDFGTNAAVENFGFMAYAPTFTGGVNVSAGEIDGAPAILTGAGPGGGPHVRVFSTSGAIRHEFMAYDPNYHGGVNVLLSGPTGGDLGHIITAPASWGGPHIRAFNSSGGVLFEFMAYNGVMMNGVNLAAIPSGNTNSTTQNGGSTSSNG